MFFSPLPTPTFSQCRATERPYTVHPKDMHDNNQTTFFVPTVISELGVLVSYYTKSLQWEFHRDYATSEERVNVHIKTRDMCLQRGIVEDSSRWDEDIDLQLRTLEHVGTPIASAVCAQLAPMVSVMKQVALREQKACKEGTVLLYRFSNKGHESDMATLRINVAQGGREAKKGISFGDSLFGGFAFDGFAYDIGEGASNHGACVASYLHIHNQGVELQREGNVTKKSKTILHKEGLPPNYLEYLKAIPKHELYTATFTNDGLRECMANWSVKIPRTLITSAPFESGEEFHPRIIGDVGSYAQFDTFDLVD
ncbi:MAG: hypothetical protein V4485_02760 [Pseudomonadota bacterium]